MTNDEFDRLRNDIDAPEPACIVCSETQFGRGISCSIYFADRHFAVTELASNGYRLRRESGRAMLQREVWRQFWRYLGAG